VPGLADTEMLVKRIGDRGDRLVATPSRAKLRQARRFNALPT
jgi:hypothetical protein